MQQRRTTCPELRICCGNRDHFSCTRCCLAATQLHGLSRRTGAAVRWRPFLLGAVFKATGNEMPARVQALDAQPTKDAPTFLVGDEKFWGNDRLPASAAWAGC